MTTSATVPTPYYSFFLFFYYDESKIVLYVHIHVHVRRPTSGGKYVFIHSFSLCVYYDFKFWKHDVECSHKLF